MNAERMAMIVEMLEKNPDDPFLRYAAALEYKKFGKKSEAISMLISLMNDQPEYLATYYQLGKILEEDGRIAEAIEHYKKGKIIAEKHNDQKTLGELTEALFILEDED